MASKAIKLAVTSNMHMDTRVFEVADFNSEVNLAFEAIEEARGHLISVHFKVEHHKPVSHCPCCPLVNRAIAL